EAPADQGPLRSRLGDPALGERLDADDVVDFVVTLLRLARATGHVALGAFRDVVDPVQDRLLLLRLLACHGLPLIRWCAPCPPRVRRRSPPRRGTGRRRSP